MVFERNNQTSNVGFDGTNLRSFEPPLEELEPLEGQRRRNRLLGHAARDTRRSREEPGRVV